MPDATAVLDHAAQSVFSDPGTWAALFDRVDPSIDEVSRVSRNVVAHYRAQAADLPAHSRDDISLRWVDAILATDQRRNAVPLGVERAVSSRVQGCCRDHTLVAVAALRHHDIPARSRVGFATYLAPTWNHDHVIVEAWLDGRWRQFDPEFSEPLPGLPDPTDIPRGSNSPFLSAANVWLGHRAGLLDVDRFGVAEGLGIHGAWFVHGYVIKELAHRFGDELLLWDTWGAITDFREVPRECAELADEVARLLVRSDEDDLGVERELLARYRDDDRLHPGVRVISTSPNGGVYDVDLASRTSTQLAPHAQSGEKQLGGR